MGLAEHVSGRVAHLPGAGLHAIVCCSARIMKAQHVNLGYL